MNPMLNITSAAVRSAGKIIMRHINRISALSVKTKQRNDFVTEVDHMAEQEIIRIIHRAYPDHAILAEESGHSDTKNKDFLWIIDPLDGTTNYLHGFPQFSVSIALKHKDRLQLGVIYDPYKEEMFCASRGEGATLNNRKIRVSGLADLSGALIGTGIPFRPDQDVDAYLETLKAFIKNTVGVRRAGSAALDLAYVAAGRLDGFWEFGLNPWDMAAGIVLIQEAGGLVGDFSGGHHHMQTGNIVTGNPKIFKAMLQILRSHLK
jgi:myo-inositol-1(or 4)-monophosphatase